MEREKVITWLADEELYYRDHGDTHNSLMACNALALLKEQEVMLRKEYERGYKNGRADEAGLRDGTIMQVFNPD